MNLQTPSHLLNISAQHLALSALILAPAIPWMRANDQPGIRTGSMTTAGHSDRCACGSGAAVSCRCCGCSIEGRCARGHGLAQAAPACRRTRCHKKQEIGCDDET